MMIIREISLLKRDPEIEDVCKDDSQEKSENINDDKKQVTTLPAPYLLPKHTEHYPTLSISSKL